MLQNGLDSTISCRPLVVIGPWAAIKRDPIVTLPGNRLISAYNVGPKFNSTIYDIKRFIKQYNYKTLLALAL